MLLSLSDLSLCYVLTKIVRTTLTYRRQSDDLAWTCLRYKYEICTKKLFVNYWVSINCEFMQKILNCFEPEIEIENSDKFELVQRENVLSSL